MAELNDFMTRIDLSVLNDYVAAMAGALSMSRLRRNQLVDTGGPVHKRLLK